MSYGLKSAIITPNPSEYYSEVTDDNDKGPEERDVNTCYVCGLTSHGKVKQFSTSGLHDLLTFQPCFARTLPLLFVSDVGLFGTSKTIDLLVKLTDVNLQSR